MSWGKSENMRIACACHGLAAHHSLGTGIDNGTRTMLRSMALLSSTKMIWLVFSFAGALFNAAALEFFLFLLGLWGVSVSSPCSTATAGSFARLSRFLLSSKSVATPVITRFLHKRFTIIFTMLKLSRIWQGRWQISL